tara:strand:+ start:957 stop:1211 length:255 start_codon:yes stop_codon:yes gene_type:complete
VTTKFNSFKKLNLFDLAVARVKNSKRPVIAKKGDLIEILSPFTQGENYLGIVININDTHMDVYHSDIRKIVKWNRNVNCNICAI